MRASETKVRCIAELIGPIDDALRFRNETLGDARRRACLHILGVCVQILLYLLLSRRVTYQRGGADPCNKPVEDSHEEYSADKCCAHRVAQVLRCVKKS